tara:strand:- start:11393 stop:11716 length:324 start_codon:yes stop_codon:yes gene_type:complete
LKSVKENKRENERLTRIAMIIFIILSILVVFLAGCSNDGEIYYNSWSTSIQSLDRSNDLTFDESIHQECNGRHYVDPYTKIEYCLPENFTNYKNIHIYKIGEKNVLK